MAGQEEIDLVIEWDAHNWSKALPFWAPHLPGPPAQVLTLGERHGGLTLWAARHGLEVTATDVHGVSDLGRRRHQEQGVAHLIHYADADASDLQFDDDTYDVVMFKSMLGALSTKARQRRAMREIHRVLRPGGLLLFAENTISTPLHQWFRSRWVPWSHKWRYLDPRTDQDLFFDFEEIDSRMVGFVASLGRTEPQRRLLGKVDDGVGRLVPDHLRYIQFAALRSRPISPPVIDLTTTERVASPL